MFQNTVFDRLCLILIHKIQLLLFLHVRKVTLILLSSHMVTLLVIKLAYGKYVEYDAYIFVANVQFNAMLPAIRFLSVI